MLSSIIIVDMVYSNKRHQHDILESLFQNYSILYEYYLRSLSNLTILNSLFIPTTVLPKRICKTLFRYMNIVVYYQYHIVRLTPISCSCCRRLLRNCIYSLNH